MKIHLLPAGLLLLLMSCNQASKTVDSKKADSLSNIQTIDISGNKPKVDTSKSLKKPTLKLLITRIIRRITAGRIRY